MSRAARALATVTASFVLLATSLASAQTTPDPLDFNARFAHYSVWEGVATGVAAALTVGLVFVPPRTPDTGTNPFDETFRDAFRLSSSGGRGTAATVSDLLVAGLWSWEALVDPLVVAWGVHGESGTAAQLMLINTEVQLVTSALQGITTALAGRERPYGRNCDNPAESPDAAACAGNDRHRSFFSGHTSQAFAAASAQCMNHLNLPLYGVSPAVPCAAGYVVAAFVGGLRMMADRHYMTDVLVGASVGTLVGLLVPWLFHYREGVRPRADAGAPAPLREAIVPNGLGASYVLIF
jgi:membrane-associated phospholipid phosphatase